MATSYRLRPAAPTSFFLLHLICRRLSWSETHPSRSTRSPQVASFKRVEIASADPSVSLRLSICWEYKMRSAMDIHPSSLGSTFTTLSLSSTSSSPSPWFASSRSLLPLASPPLRAQTISLRSTTVAPRRRSRPPSTPQMGRRDTCPPLPTAALRRQQLPKRCLRFLCFPPGISLSSLHRKLHGVSSARRERAGTSYHSYVYASPLTFRNPAIPMVSIRSYNNDILLTPLL